MAERPSVYIETSVISYLVARPSSDPIVHGHQLTTLQWWESRLESVRPLASPAVIAEASRGDEEEARKRLRIIEALEVLAGGIEVEALAAAYLTRRLIPESSAFDALHLAYATYHEVDYLLTWNCRHLASAAVRKRAIVINGELGRNTPTLCTPEELMEF